MSDFSYRAQGELKFNGVPDNTVDFIKEFFYDTHTLSEHISKQVGYSVAYSLPPAHVSNVGIVFEPRRGQFLNVKESLKLVVSFLSALGVSGMELNFLLAGEEISDIEHFALEDGSRVVSAKARVVFAQYS